MEVGSRRIPHCNGAVRVRAADCLFVHSMKGSSWRTLKRTCRINECAHPGVTTMKLETKFLRLRTPARKMGRAGDSQELIPLEAFGAPYIRDEPK